MTKIIRYPNPDVQKEEITKLSENIAVGVTTLKVINTTDFEVDDYIILEAVGNEIAEQAQIDSIPDLETINLKSATGFAHGTLAPVRKTFYNEARLHRSSDNETYSQIDSKPLDWQDKYNEVTFVDASGNDDYYYKVEYFNTTNSLSRFSSVIKTPTNIGYLTVEDFQNETGIRGNSDTIAFALKFGAQMIYRKLYTHRITETTERDTEYKLDVGQDNGMGALEFADGNLDGEIDKTDFLAYEVEIETGVRTYVTSDITNVDVDRHLITFGTEHPSANHSLVIEYDLTFRKLAELDVAVRRLNLLYATNYMFRNASMKKMQKGIGSWTLNGVTIDFQGAEMREWIKDNKEEILGIIREIQRVYTRFTNVRHPNHRTFTNIRSTMHWGGYGCNRR